MANSSAITERIVTYVQMSAKLLFQCVFGLKSRVFIINADYAVVRDLAIMNGTVYCKAGGLVVFGVSLWPCLVLQR